MKTRNETTPAATATKAKPRKRDAILSAMLEIVVEHGFHDAPMSLIVERSGASTGVIYHHFESKLAIIQALYARVHALKEAHFLVGYSPEMDARTAFIQLWVNGYRFYREHRREMRFLELYEDAGFPCPPNVRLGDEMKALVAGRFRPRSEGGVLAEWPAAVLEEATLGLAARLARRSDELAAPLQRAVAERLWTAVASDPSEK